MESQVKACPTCHQEPEIREEVLGLIIIECARHGHMAMGDKKADAVKHWNIYVSFLEVKVA